MPNRLHVFCKTDLTKANAHIDTTPQPCEHTHTRHHPELKFSCHTSLSTSSMIAAFTHNKSYSVTFLSTNSTQQFADDSVCAQLGPWKSTSEDKMVFIIDRLLRAMRMTVWLTLGIVFWASSALALSDNLLKRVLINLVHRVSFTQNVQFRVFGVCHLDLSICSF